MKKDYKKPLLKVHVSMCERIMQTGTEQATGTGESGGGGHGYGDPTKETTFYDDSWGDVWKE